MKALAAILTEVNKPLELREIEWQYVQYGQVLVRMVSSGICGAQLQEIRGEKGTHFPRLMGHEGVGIVEEIGYGVTTVGIGDKVVCHWRKGDGAESPPPGYCIPDTADKSGAVQSLTAGQVTTFSTHSVISENRLTRVIDNTPYELACLLGCSLSTALGTIEHEAKLLMGESVLIIGCGGLGLNLILAAKLRQAGKIVVIETMPKKYELGRAMGADSMRPGFWLMENEQYDVVIDTSGDHHSIAEAMRFIAPSGRFIMVGQPKPRENVTITNARHLFDGNGKSIMATQGGRFQPQIDIPRWISAYQAGRFSIDGIVSHRFPLEKINEALDCVRNGQAGRVMIQMNEQ